MGILKATHKTDTTMGLLDALKAATADVQSEPKKETKPQPSAIKHQTSNKTKGGAKYVIPKEFKQAIEDHLKGRADMAEKLKQKGKTIDGCCDYIFDVMRKRAEKERGGKSAVGLYANPDEIFGLACHYYDESEESLKLELNDGFHFIKTPNS